MPMTVTAWLAVVLIAFAMQQIALSCTSCYFTGIARTINPKYHSKPCCYNYTCTKDSCNNRPKQLAIVCACEHQSKGSCVHVKSLVVLLQECCNPLYISMMHTNSCIKTKLNTSACTFFYGAFLVCVSSKHLHP